jgi:hypothetical protein
MARADGGVLIMWLRLIVAEMLMRCSSGGAAGIGNLRWLWTVVFVSPWMFMPLAGRSRHTWTTTVTTISLALYHRRRALKPSRTMTLSIVQSGQCGARIVAFVEVTDGEMSAGIVTPTRAVRLSCRTRRRRRFGWHHECSALQ